MDILNPGNLNYWEQILKNKEDIESLKKNSNMFTYVVGHATSIDNMPFDSDNIEINKNDFRGYIINRVINDNPNYTLNVTYNSQNYETDLFIFFGTEKGLYLICFPVYNNESILYLGKWNGITYEYCNQITQDLADSIQELTETLSNYQPLLTAGNGININNNVITLNLDTIYPVGSIYMSVNDTSPASVFGGSWEKIKDTFLLGSGDTYVNGNSGGEATHTLTTGEMPSHKHDELFSNGAYATWEGFSNASQQGTRTVTGVEIPSYNHMGNATGTYHYLFTSSEGGDTAHNNMPPYLVVNMWKRIA